MQTQEAKKKVYELSREHLANERTFLAWIRTSIALMGFGFVIIKFSLFLKELSFMFDVEDNPQLNEGSSHVGVLMFVLGVIIAFLAFFRYRKIGQQLDNKAYLNSVTFSLVLTIAMVLFGILVFVLYLLPIV